MNWEKLLNAQTDSGKPVIIDDARSAFERDYDRLIFSQPFRRLQDKTQVFPVPDHDFVHTRLTHSLEVSSVARSLGKLAGKVVLERHPELSAYSEFHFGSICAAAALAHDMGNPPFGHSGEKAISDFFVENDLGSVIHGEVDEKCWTDLTNFEGNAMGFRLMNLNNYEGLKLTFATQAAFSKYPRESLIEGADPGRKSQKKYGFFQTEKKAFEQVAVATGLKKLGDELAWARHPLTFLVEAADDICYHIIDLEDGFRMGLVPYETVHELMVPILGDLYDDEKLSRIPGKKERIGMLRALAINRLISECVEVFLENEHEILDGSFDRDLIGSVESKSALNEIITLSVRDIYRSRIVLEKEVAGFEVISGLFNTFLTAAWYDWKGEARPKHKIVMRLLPPEHQLKLKNSDTAYEAVMCIIDFISSMTDRYAVSLFHKITGTI